tara:strand:- start:604 stop:741 length:138 start_codon:yes stop_codon:yes gene_type:complete
MVKNLKTKYKSSYDKNNRFKFKVTKQAFLDEFFYQKIALKIGLVV